MSSVAFIKLRSFKLSLIRLDVSFSFCRIHFSTSDSLPVGCERKSDQLWGLRFCPSIDAPSPIAAERIRRRIY